MSVGPVNPGGLIVSRRSQPELNLPSLRKNPEGQEEATIEFRAVSGEGVHFVARVVPLHDSGTASSTRTTPNADDIATGNRPLALHANQSRMEVKDQVIAAAVAWHPSDRW